MDFTKKCRWAIVVGYTLLIYFTLPLMPPVVKFLNSVTRGNLTLLIYIGYLLVGAGLIIYILKNSKVMPLSSYFWFLGLGIIYTYCLLNLKIPQEKIHFIEYGLLAYFVYRALKVDKSSLQTYFFTFLITGALGWIDEGIQKLLPNRVYDIRDVVMNAFSGLLAVLFIKFVLRK